MQETVEPVPEPPASPPSVYEPVEEKEDELDADELAHSNFESLDVSLSLNSSLTNLLGPFKFRP